MLRNVIRPPIVKRGITVMCICIGRPVSVRIVAASSDTFSPASFASDREIRLNGAVGSIIHACGRAST